MHSASKIFSLSSLSCPSQSVSHIAVPAPILPMPIINLRFNRSRIYAKIYVMLRWCDCLITLSWKCDKLYVLMPFCSITHILRIFILPSFVVHLKVLYKLQIWSWKCKSCSRFVWMPQIYTALLVSVLVFFCLVLIIGKPSNGVLHRLCLGRPSHSGIERESRKCARKGASQALRVCESLCPWWRFFERRRRLEFEQYHIKFGGEIPEISDSLSFSNSFIRTVSRTRSNRQTGTNIV